MDKKKKARFNSYKSSNSSSSTTGVTIFETLLVVFVVLKLVPGTDVNNWSWWWVLSPIWIPLLAFAFVALMVFMYFLIMNVGRKNE